MLGRRLAENINGGYVVLLYGDLGAGKTVFVKGAGDALGMSGVRSPSFTLIYEYPSSSGIYLVHADLYRLYDASGLGLEDYAGESDVLLFVEWPDRWKDIPGRNILEVHIETVNETERSLRLTGPEEVLGKL